MGKCKAYVFLTERSCTRPAVPTEIPIQSIHASTSAIPPHADERERGAEVRFRGEASGAAAPPCAAPPLLIASADAPPSLAPPSRRRRPPVLRHRSPRLRRRRPLPSVPGARAMDMLRRAWRLSQATSRSQSIRPRAHRRLSSGFTPVQFSCSSPPPNPSSAFRSRQGHVSRQVSPSLQHAAVQ
jgi:hypothetical protein